MEKDGDEIFEQFWQTSDQLLEQQRLRRQNLRKVMRASFGMMLATWPATHCCPGMDRQRLVCGENTGEITIRFYFIVVDSFITYT